MSRPRLDELEQLRDVAHRYVEQLASMARYGVSERPTVEDLEHADHYDAEAAKLRRRKANPRLGAGEDGEELERRAKLFEARAAAKRSGRPMPRELRTPAETLARVDELRRKLAAILDEASGELAPEDFENFADALGSEYARGGEGDTLQRAYGALRGLGVFRDQDAVSRFAPFRSPLDGQAIVLELRDT
jgi:hypothetical protein